MNRSNKSTHQKLAETPTMIGEIRQPIPRPRLTKSLFLRLPKGQYLVSNIGLGLGPGTPAFSEYLAPPDERSSQWQHVVASGANGRCFMLFHSRGAYLHWLKTFIASSNLNHN